LVEQEVTVLVLPLHGGPPVTATETLAVRDQVHRAVQRIIERGRTDGTISQDVTPRDVVVFGAMLAQPRQSDPEWDATCRRLLASYMNGAETALMASATLLPPTRPDPAGQ
jgi:hypothetical protein